MGYRIITGKYETGTEEQQKNFCELFGEEDIQFKFDLYFHWYNLVHELGHCLLEMYGKHMEQIDEELYVNRFAVSYWKLADGNENLVELKEMLTSIFYKLPNPVPQNMEPKEFFKSMWGNEKRPSVSLYGYFQFSCVLEAMSNESDLYEVLNEVGIKTTHLKEIKIYEGQVSSGSASDIINLCIENLRNIGVAVEDIKLEFADNPEVQCASIWS